MKFLEYLQTDQHTLDKYLNERWVNKKSHKDLPLDIYSYGRTCQYENLWDNITSRCRGIIVHRETGEIVARPFEKFHNYASSNRPETMPEVLKTLGLPIILEKVDGFMCTLYEWEGVPYIASKGSFESPHAKWATHWYQTHMGKYKGTYNYDWPVGWTPVFEGVTPNLRIVVDYGKTEELVLLALINVETGEELNLTLLESIAERKGIRVPDQYVAGLEQVVKLTLDPTLTDEEGYVCTWYLAQKPPIRVKVKYIDYLRLHRMVTGVSPKHIWEAMSQGLASELGDWENGSTEWFARFVKKWERALQTEYDTIEKESKRIIKEVNDRLQIEGNLSGIDYFHARKAFAVEFNRPENKKYAPVLFALLDNKDISPIIWKMTKRLIVGSRAMIDAHAV